MIELFQRSAEEVFHRDLGMQVASCVRRPAGTGYIAQIPFDDGETAYIARLWIRPATLKKIAKILLEESDPDESTLRDLAAEVANFVVGHAKMIASDRDLPYRMGTPRFDGCGPVPTEGHTILHKIDGRCIAVVLSEKHG